MKAYDKVYKVVLIGSDKVGKTSILDKLCSDKIKQQYIPTIGVDFRIKYLDIAGIITKLIIWDTAGQQKYQNIIQTYYKCSNIILFVFDLSNFTSFINIQQRILQCFKNKIIPNECSAILVGTKSDLIENRQVSFNQSNQLCQFIGQYIQVSSKTGQNIEQLFHNASSYKLQVDNKNQFSNCKPFMQLMKESVDQFQLFNKNKQQFKQNNKFEKKQSEGAAPKDSINIVQNKIKNSQQKNYQTIKVLLLGDAKVGKTTIFSNYNQKQILQKYQTTLGIQYRTKTQTLNQKDYKIQLWDTAGQQKFRQIFKTYLKGSKIIFLIYDITNKKSFQCLKIYFQSIKKRQQTNLPYLCIVGNKIDLQNQRIISKQQGMKLAEQQKCDFIELSAFNYDNLVNLFAKGLKQIIQNY